MITKRQAVSGFTLIELMISGALMAIVLAAGLLCLNAGLSSERVINERSEAVQTARVALSLIASDLRGAVRLSKEYEFVGMRREIEGIVADNLDFGTRIHQSKNATDGGFCEVSYFVERDAASETFTLFRRRDTTPDLEPLAGGTREEIVRNVRLFRVEYYDGWDWYEEWGDPLGKGKTSTSPAPNLSGLPEAVRITLSVRSSSQKADESSDDKEQEALTFQTSARLNMAAFFTGSSSSGSSTNSAAQNSSAPQPGGPL